MKTLALFTLLLVVGCSSDPEKRQQRQEWDSGAGRSSAFQEEGMSQRDSSVKDQFPSATPKANQSPSQ